MSRRDDESHDTAAKLFSIYARPVPAVIEMLKRENEQLPDLLALHRAVASGAAPPHISVTDGILYFKIRVYVSRDSLAQSAILAECHDTPTAGHPGVQRTLARVSAVFYWLGLSRHSRLCCCVLYVPINEVHPRQAQWPDSSITNTGHGLGGRVHGFHCGASPSNGYTAVMVVVDRLSKYAHFGALKTGFDSPRVARLFVNTVVKLHGFPTKLCQIGIPYS